MRKHQARILVEARGRGLVEISAQVADVVHGTGILQGLLTLFVRHTSASLLIQENSDADVHGDLERFFARLAPDDDVLVRHRSEGPDDTPAHVRAALTRRNVVHLLGE